MVRMLKSLLVFVIPFLLVFLLTHWMSAATVSAAQTCSVPGDFDAIQAAVDARAGRFEHKLAHDVVGIVRIANGVGGAYQHL